jgi:hypothetical protein
LTATEVVDVSCGEQALKASAAATKRGSGENLYMKRSIKRGTHAV